MNCTESRTKNIRDRLYPIIGETKVKTHFSYYGIFKSTFLLALYKDGLFYLRIAQKSLPEVLSHKGVKHLLAPSLGIHSKNFYLIPDEIVQQLENYAHWILDSLQEMEELRLENFRLKQSLIRNLPNMNFAMEKMLRKVGIYTANELIEKGAIYAFVELVKIGADVDAGTLLKLYAATQHRNLYSLTPEEKKKILQEANDALYQSGLRKQFFI